MEAVPLNALVSYYQNTGLGLAEIMERLSRRIYEYPRSKAGSGEDDCGEFYLFFYPRLLRMLARFRDQGKPFEWYFNSVLRWQYTVYCRWKRKTEQSWRAGRCPDFWEPPDFSPSLLPAPALDARYARVIPIDRRGLLLKAADRRRILFLALKNARSLDDSALASIGRLTGVQEEQLAALVEKLRADLYDREIRLHRLYVRRNRTFTRILLLQQQLSCEVETERKAELALKLAGLRSRLRSAQARIARVNLRPSNRQIAELLSVPKGTVDTSLFWLRNRLSAWEARQQEPDTLRQSA